MRLYTQDCVLGYSQPSLRDLILEWLILTETLKARDTARLNRALIQSIRAVAYCGLAKRAVWV